MAKEQDSMVKVLYFTADYCGPCKMEDSKFNELRKNEKYNGKVNFSMIDVDENTELAKKYNIRAVPTIIIEDGGVVFKKYVGVTHEGVLEEGLNTALYQRGTVQK